MEHGEWTEIERKLTKLNNNIFDNYELFNLTDYEKRKIIFDYLCNHLQYDYHLLNNIKLNMERKISVLRNPYEEVKSVIDNQIGICNAIAQVYKLLLEMNNIYSVCVICDDSTSVKHQLSLVYDSEHDVYSFDDITSVIVNRGTDNEFFDYDLACANQLGQGNRLINPDQYWVILPTDYVYYLVGKESQDYLQYGLESGDDQVMQLPSNIMSLKSLSGKTK